MCKRPGVTLMEVLVAIFIMGIGMLAMLVLFPLGVLRMAQALQDERCFQSSRMSTAIANFQGVRNDMSVLGVVTITNCGAGYSPATQVNFVSASGSGAAGTAQINSSGQIVGVVITNPGSGYKAGVAINVTFSDTGGGNGATASASSQLMDSFTFPGTGWNLLPADPNGPSYPVFVDPMGFWAIGPGQPGNWQSWVAGNTALVSPFTISRRTTQYCTSFPANAKPTPDLGLTLRWTCLLDDIPFNIDSTAQYDAPGSASFTRDIRYCSAYMLKRPRTADPSVVDLSVVVYNSRPILSSAFNEYLYQTPNKVNQPNPQLHEVTFDPILNTITIDVSASGNTVPPVRPGDWLLDASYIPNPASYIPNSPGIPYGTVNGYFYRVVGVTENSEQNYTFEIQQPLRNMTATMATDANGSLLAWQKVLFLEGVAEVFEKGSGRLP